MPRYKVKLKLWLEVDLDADDLPTANENARRVMMNVDFREALKKATPEGAHLQVVYGPLESTSEADLLDYKKTADPATRLYQIFANCFKHRGPRLPMTAEILADAKAAFAEIPSGPAKLQASAHFSDHGIDLGEIQWPRAVFSGEWMGYTGPPSGTVEYTIGIRGYDSGHRWNGWACPEVTIEGIRGIIAWQDTLDAEAKEGIGTMKIVETPKGLEVHVTDPQAPGDRRRPPDALRHRAGVVLGGRGSHRGPRQRDPGMRQERRTLTSLARAICDNPRDRNEVRRMRRQLVNAMTPPPPTMEESIREQFGQQSAYEWFPLYTQHRPTEFEHAANQLFGRQVDKRSPADLLLGELLVDEESTHAKVSSMENTALPVTPAEKEAAAALKRRNDLLRELDIENKTEVQKTTARLDRVQLFLFLTECMENLLAGKVLMSRPSANRFWCQTGFTIQEKIIFAKFGEGLMQPIGYDTGTEFWMTSGAKFLWKHEFCFVDTKAGALPAPYTVIVHEREEDNSGLTPGERDNLTRIAKDVGEVLDGRRPEDFKRDPTYVPNHAKAKYGPGELIEQTRKFLEENEDKITKEAIKVANAKLALGNFDESYAAAAEAAKEAGAPIPELKLWAQGIVASEMAEEAAASFSQKIAKETVPYTEAELDDLAWQAQYKANCLDTLKYWAMNSKLLDQRLQKIHEEHPEVGENFEKADIVSLLASVAAWANTSVQDDRIARVIRNTEVKALTSPEKAAGAEATIAGRLMKPVAEARAALGSKIEELEENDPKLVRALGVISQARVALPVVEAKLQELDEVGLDVALDAIAAVLAGLQGPQVPTKA